MRKTRPTLHRPSFAPGLLWFAFCAEIAFFLEIIGFEFVYGNVDSAGTAGLILYNMLTLLLDSSVDEGLTLNNWNRWGHVFGYVAFYGALLQVLALLFGDEWRTWRCQGLREHAVFCNLNGEARAFIANLRKHNQRQKLVAFVAEHDCDALEFCRRRRVIAVFGDALNAEHLAAVSLAQAERLLCCGLPLEDTLRVAAAARLLCRDRTAAKPLRFYTGFEDAALTEVVANHDIYAAFRPDRTFAPYPYCPEQWVARHFFLRHAPHLLADLRRQTRVCLVFAGFCGVVEALLVQYAKIWPYKDFTAPRFVLLGPDSEAQRLQLTGRYPALDEICRLEAVQCGAEYRLEAAHWQKLADATYVLFCADGGGANLQRALQLRQAAQQAGYWRIPFFIYTPGNDDFHSLLSGAADAPIPFGAPARIFNWREFEHIESNARHSHEAYCARFGQENSAGDSFKPWDELPETYRQANRRLADHLPVKLASIGYWVDGSKAVSLADGGTILAAQQELLSRLEHQSWSCERRMNGWRFGTVRDNARKIHPALVPWESLPESERSKDTALICATRFESSTAPSALPEVRIGVYGGLRISAERAQAAAATVRDSVMPALLAQHRDSFISVLTPLAPGADYCLTRGLLQGLRQAGIAHRLLVIRTLPQTALIDAFMAQHRPGDSWDGGSAPASAEAIAAALQELLRYRRPESFIDLCPDGVEPAYWNDAEHVAAAQRRAWEYLENRCAALIVCGGEHETCSDVAGQPRAAATRIGSGQAQQGNIWRV